MIIFFTGEFYHSIEIWLSSFLKFTLILVPQQQPDFHMYVSAEQIVIVCPTNFRQKFIS